MPFLLTCAVIGSLASFIMKALSKTITTKSFVIARVVVSWGTFLCYIIWLLGFF
ncbi:MAG: hypothetical protein IJB36_06205 [Clostridia bacterium]|nr:hypothetical protein [Clostridia bacterium]